MEFIENIKPYGDSKINLTAVLYFADKNSSIKGDKDFLEKLKLYISHFKLKEDEFEFHECTIAGNSLIINFVVRPNLAPSDVLTFFKKRFTTWISHDRDMRRKYIRNGRLFNQKYKVEVAF